MRRLIIGLLLGTVGALSVTAWGYGTDDRDKNTLTPSTTAAVGYAINPTTGNDTLCAPCATVAGAVAQLPNQINHAVTLTIANGAYTVVGATFFGDFSRFTYGANGSITIGSASRFTRAATTTTYALSAGATQGFTLGSDPSFSANAYRGYFVRVASGTGNGSIAVIRSNSGTAWTIAGQWSGTTPDNTSTIEILEDSVVLTLSDAASTRVQLQGSYLRGGQDVSGLGLTGSVTTNQLIFDDINLTATNNVIMDVNGLNIALIGRYIKVEFDLNGARALSGLGFFDGGAVNTSGVLVRGGSARLASAKVNTLSTNSVYVRNSTLGCVAVATTSDPNASIPISLNLFKIALDSCGTAGIYASGNRAVNVTLSSQVNGSGSTYGMLVNGGATVTVGASSNFATIDVTGGTADINLDGVLVAWAQVSTAQGAFVTTSKSSSVGLLGSGSNAAGINEILLSTTTAVNWNTGTKTTLYTVPTGKTALFTKVIVRSPSAAVVAAICGFGRDANAADYSPSTNYAGLATANNYVEVPAQTSPTVAGVVGAAADTFGTKCTVVQGSTLTVTIDVFGYLY